MRSPPRWGRPSTHEQNRRAIQRDFEGPRTIAFLNPKGGAAKTTGVLAAGYTFGTVRGGGVVAWDNNETRGTLGIRGHRSNHRNTTRELLEDLERFNDVYQARIGDLGAFVRSQGDAHFDILASDERPDVTGMIRAKDFSAVHGLLERFYRLILVDTGNNLRAENWLAAAQTADLLVVTSTIREDTGYSGLWMLDALQDAGYENLKHKTVTVLSDPSSHVDEQLAHDLVQVYEQRTKAVYRVPYDPVLVSGSVVPYAMLSEGTRSAWLRACAGMSVLSDHRPASVTDMTVNAGLSGTRLRHTVAFALSAARRRRLSRSCRGGTRRRHLLTALWGLGEIEGVEAFEVAREVSPKNHLPAGTLHGVRRPCGLRPVQRRPASTSHFVRRPLGMTPEGRRLPGRIDFAPLEEPPGRGQEVEKCGKGS